MNLDALAKGKLTPEALEEFIAAFERIVPGFLTHAAPQPPAPSEDDALEESEADFFHGIADARASCEEIRVQFFFHGEQATQRAELLRDFFNSHNTQGQWPAASIITLAGTPCVEIDPAFLNAVMHAPTLTEELQTLQHAISKERILQAAPNSGNIATSTSPNPQPLITLVCPETFQEGSLDVLCAFAFHGKAHANRAYALKNFMDTMQDQLLPVDRERTALERTSVVQTTVNRQRRYAVYVPTDLMHAVLIHQQQHPQEVREIFTAALARQSDTGPETTIGQEGASHDGGLAPGSGRDSIEPIARQ